MSLGQLVLVLQHSASYLLTIRSQLRDLKEKLNSVNQLSSVELSSFLNDKSSRLGVIDQQSAAADKIKEKIQEKEHEWSLSTGCVENAIFVIWRHLDYYFHSTRQRIGKFIFFVKSKIMQFQAFLSSFTDIDPIIKSRRTSDSWIDSEESVEKLKKDTRVCFNDIFFRKLDNIESTLEEDQQSIFFSTLNRRLKRIATLYA